MKKEGNEMMLCDELKAETVVPQGTSITLQMYGKGEVDEAIAELKRENKRLNRALWLARAERAKSMQTNRVFLKGYLRKHKNSWLAKDKELAGDLFKEAFEIVERKCRAKAEEYK